MVWTSSGGRVAAPDSGRRTAWSEKAGQPADEKEMDLHNNGVGLGIGTYYFIPDSDKSLSEQCYKALQNGKLKVIKP